MSADSLAARYDALRIKREPFLKRAREYAELTIPSLLPPEGHSYHSRLPEPYQGFGSRAVVNLSSRLMTALLPVGTNFFRLNVPAATVLQSGAPEVPVELERGLVLAEKLISSEVERKNWRLPTSLTLQLLIVTGNALEQMLPDKTIRIFRLDQYVCVRDSAGNVVEIIIEENLSPLKLPEKAKALVDPKDRDNPQADVTLYTAYKLKSEAVWESWQEIEGIVVPDSKGEYRGALPVFPLRWAPVPGEDYGRGKVEEHIGDLRTLERLSQSMVDGAAMAARHVWLTRPNAAGGNLRQRIAKANNGDVLSGNPEDVTMLQFTNVAGLQIVQAEIQRITMSLSYAFLMMNDLRRDAERVTAYELRQIAEELEGALGGVYSMLSEQMQKRRLERLILQMQKEESLPPWSKDDIDPQITTGLEALGREQDVNRVMTATQVLSQMGSPEVYEYVKLEDLLKRAFNGLQLAGAIRSEDEVAQRRQQMMDQQVAAANAQSMGQAQAKAQFQPPR